ncbi:hypothetical protein [Solidesulfovibrio magneticus]|uniref:Uncharacterized protein n=1 Tax=Solidesulfovibrio magneticus (strain ATCC 700980 / DSM 13731 / RS-1) TaxID=573370 RepID=C4XLN5_SOLM1|nr:hypothetical protein [Solidesulfovibrio magneticus]BAH74623.1 hypothetical protein DMR_11320 [Solidesulfovibrio magneticus RS-1]
MDADIKITLQYYNKTHRELLSNYPSFKTIDQLVTTGCDIPFAEFFTYYLFYKKRPNLSGYDSYESISRKIDLAHKELDGFILLNNKSIVANPVALPLNNAMTERIGEGIGLSVVNKIHGLTGADWRKIPEQNKFKTLDYEIASDGNNIIQIETKGNCSNDNTEKNSSISSHKKSIEEKKKQVRSKSQQTPLMYGTIAAVSSNSHPIRCWILDPEPTPYDRSPQETKLLNRLSYLSAWTSYISPRSNLSATLLNRTNLIDNAKDPFEFDNIPLLNSHREPFNQYRIGGKYNIDTFFLGKSYVINHNYTGIVRFSGINCFVFIGISEDVVKYAVYQKYEEILHFQKEAFSSTVEIICSIPKWHWTELSNDLKRKISSIETRNAIQFKLMFRIYQSKSGLAIGFCDKRSL